MIAYCEGFVFASCWNGVDNWSKTLVTYRLNVVLKCASFDFASSQILCEFFYCFSISIMMGEE